MTGQPLEQPEVSVVVCTHNPRSDYLERVLISLRRQTLDHQMWELIIVDNASADSVADRFDISWHPAGRHVTEQELGLTPARLRGISEAVGQQIYFVDDDNILEPDFLVEAQKISVDYPFLGAWGGEIRALFESDPPEWTRAHWPKLAIRDVAVARWSNAPDDWQSTPWGAGLCIRRQVAEAYLLAVKDNPDRRKLDRRGSSLSSGGDSDIVLSSREIGLGWGVFPTLAVGHLISPSRLTLGYLLRLTEATAQSGVVVARSHGLPVAPETSTARRFAKAIQRTVRFGLRNAQFFLAEERGRTLGIRESRSENLLPDSKH